MSSDEKPFFPTRHRVGVVKYLVLDKRFGFIDAEDFREDVFFHFEIFEPKLPGQIPYEGQSVEFEVDEERRVDTKQLRALAVRPTDRPVARRLAPRDAPALRIRHHPKAQRKRPTWRKKDES